MSIIFEKPKTKKKKGNDFEEYKKKEIGKEKKPSFV